jgi:hypothetical protein
LLSNSAAVGSKEKNNLKRQTSALPTGTSAILKYNNVNTGILYGVYAKVIEDPGMLTWLHVEAATFITLSNMVLPQSQKHYVCHLFEANGKTGWIGSGGSVVFTASPVFVTSVVLLAIPEQTM